MKLSELKRLLRDNSNKSFRLRLPDGAAVPHCFHVTEVGRVHKIFLDCGGTLRELTTCQLQVWIGEDIDHRIETGKMAAILEKAGGYLPDESIPVEVEYEHAVISRYDITGHEADAESVVLQLENKHTECLAPELCKIPAKAITIKGPAIDKCCGPSGCR